MTKKLSIILLLGAWFLLWTSVPTHALLYVAPTGQTASAEFNFIDSGLKLEITLAETTPIAVSDKIGAPAILTSIGFILPDDAVIAGGNVIIADGSQSVGFDTGTFSYPTNVNGEWGYTIGEAPIGLDSYQFDFVSSMVSQTTPFGDVSADNLDGSTSSLDGPQAGLLYDSAARGGLGVIDNSVLITLLLDADPSTGGNQPLSPDQQTAFLASLSLPANSVVEYGSDAAFGTVPEPATVLLLGTGLVGLAGFRKKFKK